MYGLELGDLARCVVQECQGPSVHGVPRPLQGPFRSQMGTTLSLLTG